MSNNKKELSELELLREQNELLKAQLEKKGKDESSGHGGIIAVVVIVCLMIVGAVIYLANTKDDSNNGVNNTTPQTTQNDQKKECVRWENDYNYDYCKYSPSSNGCRVTGQTCKEWK